MSVFETCKFPCLFLKGKSIYRNMLQDTWCNLPKPQLLGQNKSHWVTGSWVFGQNCYFSQSQPAPPQTNRKGGKFWSMFFSTRGSDWVCPFRKGLHLEILFEGLLKNDKIIQSQWVSLYKSSLRIWLGVSVQKGIKLILLWGWDF